MKRAWCTYILRCADGTLYAGATNDLPARIKAHNAGKGAKYTRARLPVTCVWKRRAGSKGAALRREAAVKALTRAEKLLLINEK